MPDFIKNIIVRWLLAGMLLLAAQVQAVTVSNLYSATVAQSGAGPAALASAYRDGLGQVLVRVSGSQQVLQREGIGQVLDAAESILESYQVLNSEGTRQVQMSFGAVAVTQALGGLQAPVWGANRPLTLAWIALEERGSRTLVTQTSGSESATLADSDSSLEQFRAGLSAAAAARGLPLQLPAPSNADNRELLSDIWGQFVGRVRTASNDISRDAMALVRVSRSGEQWRAGWLLDGFNGAGNSGEQTVTAASPFALAQVLVNRWADVYAGRYGVSGGVAGQQPTVDLVLQGVATLADYAEVSRALAQVNAVESLAPAEVNNSELTMRLSFSGELSQLRELLALDSRLVPQPVAAGASPEQALQTLYPVLTYRWQPAPVPAVAP